MRWQGRSRGGHLDNLYKIGINITKYSTKYNIGAVLVIRFVTRCRLQGDQEVLETDVPTEKPRFSISFTPEFLKRLEAYCERQSETKSKVLEELADIIIGMSDEKLQVLEQWADEEFRTVAEQVKHILHKTLTEHTQQE